MNDDKRLIPQFGPKFWCERKSLKKWADCKYCYKSVPVFRLSEGAIGDADPISVLLCCWECGAGLDRL